MAEKKAQVKDKPSPEELKKAVRFKWSGVGLMVFGGLDLVLRVLNPLYGFASLTLGLLLFDKGRRMLVAKK